MIDGHITTIWWQSKDLNLGPLVSEPQSLSPWCVCVCVKPMNYQ